MEKTETKASLKKRILSINGMGQVLTVSAGLIVLCIVFGIINPTFFSTRNIGNLLRQIAPFILIGIGQSYVLITGNIDLSIGSVIGMSTMLSATMMTKGVNPWAAIFITLIACLAVGVLNGYLVAGFSIPPFIATLGTMTIARGIAQIANGNYNTNSIGEAAEGFRNFFYYGKTIGIYNTFWIAIIIFLIFNFYLSKTKTGRHIYAVGSNINAAKLSGVSVTAVTIKVYVVSAFCAALTGFTQCVQNARRVTLAENGSGNRCTGNSQLISDDGGGTPVSSQSLIDAHGPETTLLTEVLPVGVFRLCPVHSFSSSCFLRFLAAFISMSALP